MFMSIIIIITLYYYTEHYKEFPWALKSRALLKLQIVWFLIHYTNQQQ